MLIQFSLGNFASFKDETVLNMSPVKSRIMKDHIIKDTNGKNIHLLSIACIYGANASGKTNFVSAIEYAQTYIIEGVKPNALTGVTPNLLDQEEKRLPARFEFIFKHKKVVYTYGFSLDEKVVHEEWLFGYFSSQESKLFERVTKEDKVELIPGQKLVDGNGSKFINFIAKGTRPNQLFLTEAIQKNVEILKPVMEWFAESLVVIKPDSRYLSLAVRVIEDKGFECFLREMLRVADVGIEDIEIEKEVFDTEKHLKGFNEKIRTDILDKVSSSKFAQIYIQGPDKTFLIIKDDKGQLYYHRLKTAHKKSDGNLVTFDTVNESDGTKRLMDLAPMLFDFKNIDRVYVIDELDRSLHTTLARLFIEMCVSRTGSRSSKAQYIMTTHDTNLLDRELLRKDEIWFMEKDRHGSSHLTSLSDYNTSQGLNYENGYLNGRFGAIPLIGDWKKIFSEMA